MLIDEPKTREFQFAEPISVGGNWTGDEEPVRPLRTGGDAPKNEPNPG